MDFSRGYRRNMHEDKRQDPEVIMPASVRGSNATPYTFPAGDNLINSLLRKYRGLADLCLGIQSLSSVPRGQGVGLGFLLESLTIDLLYLTHISKHASLQYLADVFCMGLKAANGT
jgi:hypothetical protein